jgi:hypothetical protein
MLFECPACGKIFGIVPGIPNVQQGPSTPSRGSGELPADGSDPSGADDGRPDPDTDKGQDVAGHGVALLPTHPSIELRKDVPDPALDD